MRRFLTDFWDFVLREHYNVLRMSHWHAGKMETADIVRAYPGQQVYSLAKVLTMTAVGLLVDEGKLSVDDRALPLLLRQEDILVNDSRWDKVCIGDLLGHRAGLPEGFLDVDQQDWESWGTFDFLQYTLQTSLEYEPGKERAYSDGAYYLLGRIVENVSGTPLMLYLRKKLLNSIGIRNTAWSTCPLGHAMGATGLYISTEDLCKIGLLYHQNGVYDGRRFLSEDWVRLVRDREWELAQVHQNGTYGKGGMKGQMLLIVPSADRVVAWQAFERKGSDRLIRFVAVYGAGR